VNLFKYIDSDYVEVEYIEDLSEFSPSPGPTYEQGQDDYFEAGYIDAEYFQNPNSYFEAGYIDEDYLRPPKTNGYYEEGYIDEAYFESIVSMSSASLAYFSISAVGEIAEPTGEVKEFEADWISEFALAADAGKIVDATIDAQAEFTVEIIISHIEGADLFAFSEALLAVEVQRIRDINVEATSTFNIATDVERIQQGAADADSEFTTDIDAERSREFDLETQAAFSFDIEAYRTQEVQADIASEFSQTVDIVVQTDVTADLSADSEIFCVISHILGADIIADGFAAFEISIDIFRNVSSDIISESTAEVDGSVIGGAEVNANADTDIDITYIRIREGETSTEGYRPPRTVEIFGNAAVDANIKQIGSGSIAFDGSGDFLSVAHEPVFDIINTDMTYEMWVYNKENRETNIGGVIDFPLQLGQTSGFGFSTVWNWGFGTDQDGRALLLTRTATGGIGKFIHQTTVPLNTWTHLAFTYNKANGQGNIWVNGVKITNAFTIPSDLNRQAYPLRIARTGFDYFGNIDELRVSNTVRYTADFTPSTQAFDNDDNTLLLIHGEPTIEDDGGKSPVLLEATLTAEVGTIKQFDSDITSNSALSAVISVTYDEDVALQSTASIFCVISHILGADIIADGFATLTADVGVIRQGNSNLESEFDLSISAVRIQQASADITATTSVVATASRLFSLEAQVFSFTETVIESSVLYDSIIDLQVEGFILSTGFIYHINEQVYKIPRENRSWTILAENRTAKIRR